jgi:hypothetical protein
MYPDRIRAGQREARVLGALMALIAGTGVAGTLFPDQKATITCTVAGIAVFGLAARLGYWRLREWRRDRADRIAATAARTAIACRRGELMPGTRRAA